MPEIPSVITAGETMVLAVPERPARLRHAPSLELKIAGAESNVAIALSRLGIPSGWMSLLGDDEPGQLVLDRIRGEGVDTSRVSRVESSFTGLFLRERVNQTSRAYYYRKDSAASRLAPESFEASYMNGAGILHLTGVTPALSESCAGFVRWAMAEARERGLRVSFDINYRSKLWPQAAAREFMDSILGGVDVLFISSEEALSLWQREDSELLPELAARGPSELILKRGGQGSSAYINGEWIHQRAFKVPEVDEIGAGDAFAAGYLAGLMWELPPARCVELASALGAYSVMTLGDYEGLPEYGELSMFVAGKEEPGR